MKEIYQSNTRVEQVKTDNNENTPVETTPTQNSKQLTHNHQIQVNKRNTMSSGLKQQNFDIQLNHQMRHSADREE